LRGPCQEIGHTVLASVEDVLGKVGMAIRGVARDLATPLVQVAGVDTLPMIVAGGSRIVSRPPRRVAAQVAELAKEIGSLARTIRFGSKVTHVREAVARTVAVRAAALDSCTTLVIVVLIWLGTALCRVDGRTARLAKEVATLRIEIGLIAGQPRRVAGHARPGVFEVVPVSAPHCGRTKRGWAGIVNVERSRRSVAGVNRNPSGVS
jgi:hypothetical protein